MRTVIALVVAGVVIASAGVAGVNDQMAEERYRAKYGRYSPAEERRQHASEEARRNTSIGCQTKDCCHAASQNTAENLPDTRTGSDATQRFIAKWGRNPFEAEPSRAMAASSVNAATAPSDSADNRSVHHGDAAARLQAKTGRTGQLDPAATQARSRVRNTELLAQASLTCEQECCARRR